MIRAMVVMTVLCCGYGCRKTIVEVSKPMLVGTYETPVPMAPEVEMKLTLNSDDTFLLVCRNGGERSRGTWSVLPPYIVRLDATPDAIKGSCAGFLPLSTTVTMSDGMPAIGIDANYGIKVVKQR